MKRIASIIILAVLLLQGLGFNWVDDLMNYQADKRMQARINQGQYNPHQLIELSVKLSLPYTTNWGEWEQVEGEVMVNGIAYRYVERKLENGIMHVRCIPNMERQRIAMQSFANQRSKFLLPHTRSHDHLGSQPNISGVDYDDCLGYHTYVLSAVSTSFDFVINHSLRPVFYGVVSPPPEQIA